jgi:RNA polymerase sigma-70 factor (ECF subfamily)
VLEHSQTTCQPETYQSLFDRYAGALRRFVYYKCGNWAGAEDFVQEAFLRLWKNCTEVPPDKAKSYLYTVANRLFLDEVRHQKVVLRFAQEAQTEPEGSTPGADQHLEASELQVRLERAISDLPEGQREVFLMNRVEKMTYAEIAERLELSVKAVEKRMHQALLALRAVASGS